ncbi:MULTISPECIES: hypothetical protein [unclassified Wolbachia]|nr:MULTISPECIES: hypothetical protein [unclassified Wolbachia]
MNYDEGKEANPFNKIAKYYGRNKNVSLFIATLVVMFKLKRSL